MSGDLLGAGVEGVGRIAPGRGRKPSLPDATVAWIVAVTRRERPADGSTHWTTRSLAAKLGVSHETSVASGPTTA